MTNRTAPNHLATERALSPPSPTDMLEEAMSHLGACQMQRIPSDDKIIAGHIDVAHALIAALWKANRRLPASDEIVEAARDLVALWKAQKIFGASRAERNGAIEGARERLIAAVERGTA